MLHVRQEQGLVFNVDLDKSCATGILGMNSLKNLVYLLRLFLSLTKSVIFLSTQTHIRVYIS